MRTQPLAVAVHACQWSMDLGRSPVGLGRPLAIADAESDSPHPRGSSLFEWSSGFPWSQRSSCPPDSSPVQGMSLRSSWRCSGCQWPSALAERRMRYAWPLALRMITRRRG